MGMPRIDIASGLGLVISCGVLFAGAATDAPWTPASREAQASLTRVLFIGNSLTYSQNGLYFHLERLAASARPPIAVTTDRVVVGGASLKTLWGMPAQRSRIAAGTADIVVLQEDLPETTIQDFREHARKFVGAITAARARPVLLMAWAYRRLGWISMTEIAQAHRDAGRELGVDVAPAGVAWEQVRRERPDLNLFVADNEHPSILGTYLVTSVVFATVFGKDPTPLSYVPDGVSADAGRYLRQVAWDALQAYRSPSK